MERQDGVGKQDFAGPRVRRIRNGLGLTQTAMAEALAISPSYLNLIERNQRPLTVQLLLKLASVYKVDLDDLQGESAGSAGQLREVFADPLLVGEVPSPQEPDRGRRCGAQCGKRCPQALPGLPGTGAAPFRPFRSSGAGRARNGALLHPPADRRGAACL